MKGENIRDSATCPEAGPWKIGQWVFGEIKNSVSKNGLHKMIISECVFNRLRYCIWP